MPFVGTHGMVLLLNFVCITLSVWSMGIANSTKVCFCTNLKTFFFRWFHGCFYGKDSPFFLIVVKIVLKSMHFAWLLQHILQQNTIGTQYLNAEMWFQVTTQWCSHFFPHRQKTTENTFHLQWKMEILDSHLMFSRFYTILFVFWVFFWLCRHLNMDFFTWCIHCTKPLLHYYTMGYSRKWFNVQKWNILSDEKKDESKSEWWQCGAQYKMMPFQ